MKKIDTKKQKTKLLSLLKYICKYIVKARKYCWHTVLQGNIKYWQLVHKNKGHVTVDMSHNMSNFTSYKDKV